MGTCAVACDARTATANCSLYFDRRDRREKLICADSRPPRSSSMRHDDVLRPASERMKLFHCPRELPWLLGPRIPGTFHLNKKEYHRRNELSLERPRHFAAS